MFAEVLESIFEKVEGILGVIVLGMDGISIEKRSREEVPNLEALAAEYTSLLKGSSATTQDIGLGILEEMIVSSDTRVVLVRMVTPEYFLLAILDGNGNIGRARFELRKAKFSLEKELVI
jgi:predicted regulator of Ras-like GTPase activity (Roadblock/LC7/MglB family)